MPENETLQKAADTFDYDLQSRTHVRSCPECGGITYALLPKTVGGAIQVGRGCSPHCRFSVKPSELLAMEKDVLQLAAQMSEIKKKILESE